MKKMAKLAAVVLFTFLYSMGFTQSKGQIAAKGTIQITPKTNDISEKLDVKSQLIKAWQFHEILLRTPKDGYLFRIADKEVGVINLLVANYTFNEDGSITLDPKYIEKQGVNEAKWQLNDVGNLAITYLWTPEKQKDAGFSNNYEKLEYKIDIISDKELSINLMDMFIVNLITK